MNTMQISDSVEYVDPFSHPDAEVEDSIASYNQPTPPRKTITARTYWVRTTSCGYLGFDGEPTMNIDDIKDFPDEASAVRGRNKLCPEGEVVAVTFDWRR